MPACRAASPVCIVGLHGKHGSGPQKVNAGSCGYWSSYIHREGTWSFRCQAFSFSLNSEIRGDWGAEKGRSQHENTCQTPGLQFADPSSENPCGTTASIFQIRSWELFHEDLGKAMSDEGLLWGCAPSVCISWVHPYPQCISVLIIFLVCAKGPSVWVLSVCLCFQLVLWKMERHLQGYIKLKKGYKLRGGKKEK